MAVPKSQAVPGPAARWDKERPECFSEPPTGLSPPWLSERRPVPSSDGAGQRATWRRARARRAGRSFVGSLSQFDGSGLEGDGPPRRAEARPAVNLMVERGLRDVTSQRRAKLLRRFNAWLMSVYALSLAVFWQLDIGEADALLALYGQASYDGGFSMHDFSETINAIVDGRRDW